MMTYLVISRRSLALCLPEEPAWLSALSMTSLPFGAHLSELFLRDINIKYDFYQHLDYGVEIKVVEMIVAERRSHSPKARRSRMRTFLMVRTVILKEAPPLLVPVCSSYGVWLSAGIQVWMWSILTLLFRFWSRLLLLRKTLKDAAEVSKDNMFTNVIQHVHIQYTTCALKHYRSSPV